MWQRLRRWLPLRRGWLREAVEADPRYEKAKQFWTGFRPKDGADYGWVFDYSMEEARRLKGVLGELDEKADAVVRYAGALTSIVSLGFTFSIRNGVAWPALCSVPAIACMVVALAKAIGVRAPDDIPFPPTPADAIHYAELNKDPASARGDFSALLHWHRTRLWLAVNLKGTRVRAATVWLVWGIALLLLPLLVTTLVRLANP
jgi:hypothetical protein